MSDILQTVVFAPLAALVFSPFLILLGSPWLLVAWLAWISSRRFLPNHWRIVIVSFIGACGVAPLIYAHGVINVYIVALDGGKPPVGESLISVAMTWILGMIVGFLWLAKRKTARSN